MAKRRTSETPSDDRQAKRARQTASCDRLSLLSHELVLRVLSFLPVSDLILCQRVSKKLHALAGDSQLWKALYYNRFVRPRASRLPGIKDSGVAADSLNFSSKLSKWLDEENLVKRGKETNWKRQYKLRHNWSKGSCGVSEVPVSEEPSIPPTLVQMHESTIYMADLRDGLRAWNSKAAERKMLATIPFEGYGKRAEKTPPTALAVDSSSDSLRITKLAACFQDGSFSLYELDTNTAAFSHRYTHEPSSNGMLSAVALSFPYLVTMTATQVLSLYKFKEQADQKQDIIDPPRLLHSLHSHTVWPPLTLSMRPSTNSILVSIAYALPTYLSGWTVGIQEMRITLDGAVLNTRLATSIDQRYRPLPFGSPLPSSPGSPATTTSSSNSSTSEANQIHTKPTSLSYTHPYLLVSHPDNTLTLYLVSSTDKALTVSSGSRLWGHTSSVSGAHVGGRGKAVSVSSRGDELRVWELEGGLGSSASRRRLANGELSVQIRPERRSKERACTDSLTHAIAARGDGLGLALGEVERFDETSLTRGWIGFDEENVIVLKEKSCGGQALVVYDFT